MTTSHGKASRDEILGERKHRKKKNERKKERKREEGDKFVHGEQRIEAGGKQRSDGKEMVAESDARFQYCARSTVASVTDDRHAEISRDPEREGERERDPATNAVQVVAGQNNNTQQQH